MKINEMNELLGIDNNPELKAFIVMQTFNVDRFDKTVNVRGVSYDKRRNKWVARYKANEETPIIKNFFGRYDSKEEAEAAMYRFKKDVFTKLINKYPNYFVKETLGRRVDYGKADDKQYFIYSIIEDWTNDEIVDFLISTRNIYDED